MAAFIYGVTLVAIGSVGLLTLCSAPNGNKSYAVSLGCYFVAIAGVLIAGGAAQNLWA